MDSPSENRRKLEALRTLVTEKFSEPATGRRTRRREIGCEAVDGAQGGLRQGAVTEVCGSSGGALVLLSALLDRAVRESFQVALVDGMCAFNPPDWSEAQLSRVLWVRCDNAQQAMQATDLLLRDGNLPFLVVDLQGVEARELMKISPNTWHRFHRLIESMAVVLVVLTSQPMVEGAAARVAVEVPGGLDVLQAERAALLGKLQVRIFERGEVAEFAPALVRKSA